MFKHPKLRIKRTAIATIASLFIALQLPLTPLLMGTVSAAKPTQTDESSAQPADLHCPDKDNSNKIESSSGTFTLNNVTATWSGDPGQVTFTNANTTDATVYWCAKGGTNFYNGGYNTGEQITTLMPGGTDTTNFSQAVSYMIVYKVDVVQPQTNEVTPAAVTFDDKCGVQDDTYTIPATTGVDYQVDGTTKPANTYTGSGNTNVTAVAQDGYTLTGTTSWSHTFTNTPCDQPNEQVTPAMVIFTDVCGTDDDTYTIPATTGVDYQVNDITKTADIYTASGSVTVTAVAQNGYELMAATTWSHTFTNEACESNHVKVTICHRTDSNINPYVEIQVDQNAADGIAGNSGNEADHYSEHQGPLWNPTLKKQHIEWGDIIPPIEGAHDGLNWTEEGQAFYQNNCKPASVPQPSNPAISASIVPCIVGTNTNDTVSVTVTNTADDTDEPATYTITVGSQSQQLTLNDGESNSVTFKALAIGNHTAVVTADDGTSATSASVTVANCPATFGRGGGVVLGASITGGGLGAGTAPAGQVLGASTLATTGARNILGNVFAALALFGITCSLAITTRKAQY